MITTAPARRRFGRAGIIGSLLLLLAVLACIRLGFWQLDRRAERRALNERILARMQLEPLTNFDSLSDTTTSLYRTAVLAGAYDVERSIILPGRSHMGLPGVHLLTPLRIDTDRAVLINRGWVPSPDGATIPLDSMPQPLGAAAGLVVPFPGQRESRGAVHESHADSGFRRTWFRVDDAQLRAQFPYELLPFTLQLLPRAQASGYPRPLEPPALDEGPHLSYALQWFSFALIGIIGWLVLVLRKGGTRRAPPIDAALLLPLLLLLAPQRMHAQLRPLDPFDWRIMEESTDLVAGAGIGVQFAQPASLAGSRGRLLELGTWRVLWRSGRMGVEFSGTALWRFREQDSVEVPLEFVLPSGDGIRQDPGPANIATFVRVTPDAWPADVLLRFGARLPTTSDDSGLERDETDFFGLAAAQLRTGAWSFAGEAGVGIHGSVNRGYPQSDVLVYSAGARRRYRALEASAFVVGQADGHDRRIRGNEDQAELRIGLRAGRARWLELQYVHGIAGFSPDHGVRVSMGITTGCPEDCLP